MRFLTLLVADVDLTYAYFAVALWPSLLNDLNRDLLFFGVFLLDRVSVDPLYYACHTVVGHLLHP